MVEQRADEEHGEEQRPRKQRVKNKAANSIETRSGETLFRAVRNTVAGWSGDLPPSESGQVLLNPLDASLDELEADLLAETGSDGAQNCGSQFVRGSSKLCSVGSFWSGKL